MQEIDIFNYFAFGYDYWLLRFTSENRAIHDQPGSLSSTIDLFFKNLEALNLRVTLRVADDLKKIRARLGDLPKDSTVDSDLAKEINEAVNKLDATLDAELKLRSAYVVTPRRFQLDHLLKTPQSLFGKSVFENLPDICQFDFREAGRSIAFGMPTAAAFHLMRGTEGVLRHYYCSIVKRDRTKKLMWFDMVTHLEKRRDSPPKPLLDNLNNIRVNFRNPTQHPDARYDMDEAQDLLAVSIDSVNRMMRDSSGRKT